MGNSLIGWINAAKTAALTATSAEPTLPVTNLAGDHGSPATGWQTLAGALTPLLTLTPLARTTVRVAALFRSNLTSAATIIVRLYTNPGAVLVATSATVTAVNGQAIAIFPIDTPCDIITVSISDAGNPQNFVNIPLCFAGPVWQPTNAMAWSSSMGRDDINDTVTSRGGQTYVSLRATFRRWEIALDGIRTTEAYAQLDALDRFSRAGGNAILVPNLNNGFVQQESTFGIIKATADVTFPLGVDSRRSWRSRLSERL
jgi:hypothetical protein